MKLRKIARRIVEFPNFYLNGYYSGNSPDGPKTIDESIMRTNKFFEEGAAYKENKKRDKAYDKDWDRAHLENRRRDFVAGFDEYVSELKSYSGFLAEVNLFPGTKEQFEETYGVKTSVVAIPKRKDKGLTINNAIYGLWDMYCLDNLTEWEKIAPFIGWSSGEIVDFIQDCKGVFTNFLRVSPDHLEGANRVSCYSKFSDSSGKVIPMSLYTTPELDEEFVRNQRLYALVMTQDINQGIKGLPLKLAE